MSTEENKALVRQLYDEINKGNMGALDTFVRPDFVSYGGFTFSVVRGLDALKEIVDSLRTAVPDLQFTVDGLIAEDDKVVAMGTVTGTHKGNFMGMAPATGNALKWTGISIFRIQNGQIAERWFNDDDVILMQQLGVIPPNS